MPTVSKYDSNRTAADSRSSVLSDPKVHSIRFIPLQIRANRSKDTRCVDQYMTTESSSPIILIRIILIRITMLVHSILVVQYWYWYCWLVVAWAFVVSHLLVLDCEKASLYKQQQVDRWRPSPRRLEIESIRPLFDVIVPASWEVD